MVRGSSSVAFFLATLGLVTCAFGEETLPPTFPPDSLLKLSDRKPTVVEEAQGSPCAFEIDTSPGCARFTPIGWSRAGAFAYVEDGWSEEDGVISDYSATVTIQDMKRDRRLWTSSRPTASTGTPDAFWKAAAADVNAALRKHGIEALRAHALEKFPVSTTDGPVAVVLDSEKVPQQDWVPLVRRVSIDLQGGRGTKSVLTRVWKEELIFSDVRVLGCFRSPFEARIASVIAFERYGSHASSSYEYVLVGSHLENGFAKSPRPK